MKRPNGYGSVVKMGSNRRRPYAARVTDMVASQTPDKDGIYRQKYKYIGYFENKEDAFDALEKYNEHKVPIDTIGITFKEIWELWAEKNLDKGSKSRKDAYKAAIKKCSPIYNMRMDAIRLHHLQSVVDLYQDTSKSNLNNIKTVMGFCFEYAIKNDIVQKDYSKFVDIEPKSVNNHKPFTHKEVDELLAKKEHTYIEKLVIVYLFTGVRPAELLALKKEDIHISEQYFRIRKAKTKNGIRIVPIADKILPLFVDICNANSNSSNFVDLTYTKYVNLFKERFPNHTPHDTRTTFVSFMTEADVQQIIIQKIVGHASGSVTGDVYTKLTLQPLLSAVNKLFPFLNRQPPESNVVNKQSLDQNYITAL